MSEHVGYVVQIQELTKHPNADRLQIATIFGASVIVGLEVKIGDLGVYFPIDLQLSVEYCEQNNLIRKLDEEGKNIGGYLDPNKRNIRAMRLRGEKSEGLFMPLESLAYTGETKFEVGNTISIINGHEICRKYIPHKTTSSEARKLGNKSRKKKVPIAPLFAEHADTEQLAYNLDAFRGGDLIEITLKMHGTSGRTGYLPKLHHYEGDSFGCKAGNAFRKILAKLNHQPEPEVRHDGTPIYDWGYVTGTRRVVLSDFEADGFYRDSAFRKMHADAFEGKLKKGETVYYEIVGFITNGAPIMASVNNNKISDKKFSKQYGQTTIFSYGCTPQPEYEELPQSDMYVYRMTMTNEDGDIVEYSPAYMRYRCEQMGIKTVPVLWQGIIPNDTENRPIQTNEFFVDEDGHFEDWVYAHSAGEYIKIIAEQYYDGPDPIGKTHVREGVVIRIVDRPKFCAYKHKNFSFKVLEGIAKDLAAEPDMEEAQELEVEE